MVMNQNNFFTNCEANHDAQYMNECFNVDNNTAQKLRHMVFFVFVSNCMKVEDLYETRSMAPRELTTMTGDLVQFLKMTETQQEYEWGMLQFMHLHDMAKAAFTRYEIETKDINSFDPEQRKKIELIRKTQKMKDVFDELRKRFSDFEEEEELFDVEPEDLDKVNMDFMSKKCVLYVKKSKYHFPTYYRLATGKTLPSEEGFMNDILNIVNTPDPDL